MSLQSENLTEESYCSRIRCNHSKPVHFRASELLKEVRFTDFSDTEESGEFVVRTAEFSMDLINDR